MKTKFLFLSLFFTFFLSQAQSNDLYIKIMLEQANEMGKKFVERDYAGFLKYAHPATIKAMRGEKEALKKMNEQMMEIAKEGIIVTDVNFGTPSKIITVDSELQCTLPQILTMDLPEGKLTATTTVIAISKDNGKNWYFLDTANYNFQDMRMLLPNLSDQIVIPERTEPSFEPNTKTE
ncbi:hypothetical protein [Flavobacterium sp. AG291]|uniref:hypothetical protein n=1 Tax=Flavobacterium sp. AG291 TaxID=2184000 RepID=UPI000E0ABEBE|nr:hypothetical protein [Flavobacterium sp. AG291]RDI13105.1 hypothetical protein DEU42_10315 [Flavobacterium sp. AG291]